MKSVLRQQINRMSVQEAYNAIYCDHLTGCLNRRAMDLDDRKAVIIVDLDSLKYINDSFGHRAGDKFICWLADGLKERFDSESVYRLGGDEFAVKTDSPLLSQIELERFKEVFPCFSYGAGSTVDIADQNLKMNKECRVKTGHRVGRGECPTWINVIENFNLPENSLCNRN